MNTTLIPTRNVAVVTNPDVAVSEVFTADKALSSNCEVPAVAGIKSTNQKKHTHTHRKNMCFFVFLFFLWTILSLTSTIPLTKHLYNPHFYTKGSGEPSKTFTKLITNPQGLCWWYLSCFWFFCCDWARPFHQTLKLHIGAAGFLIMVLQDHDVILIWYHDACSFFVFFLPCILLLRAVSPILHSQASNESSGAIVSSYKSVVTLDEDVVALIP